VADSAPAGNKDMGFKDASTVANAYDANGNLTDHKDKAMTIEYNHF
jgi:hypothetical protein